ncbi:hypothetical protein CK516_14450 [Nostoc sp. 'Peltigera malacea cyanobiont' DB3992]|nr:hypothetical protein CK516_14450 [Nostoc sp. 'Peltigera malacea cyanobiont' DB3992]
MKNQVDALPNIRYEHNDLNHETPGLSNNSEFSSPLLVSSDAGLFDSGDEPTRIRALLIKGQNKSLLQNEKKELQRYYYMQDLQADKDNRYFLNETYRTGKKLLGLNAQNTQIAVN